MNAIVILANVMLLPVTSGAEASRPEVAEVAMTTPLVNASAAVTSQEVLDGFEAQARQILSEAGYRYDQAPSLIRALNDLDTTVTVVAARFLARFPRDSQIVAALRTASEAPYETLAVAAFGSLRTLGVPEWQGRAIQRLPQMNDGVDRLLLAGMLAESGRAEGWSVVQTALISDRGLTGLAIRQIAHFDGLKDLDGRTIDAAAELERVRTRSSLPTGAALEIALGLEVVKARRAR